VNPLVSSVALYESFGHNDADLIDHVTSVRLREDAQGLGLSLWPTCHDEILIKDSEFTCEVSDGQARYENILTMATLFGRKKSCRLKQY
jgi:hypothetical protein